MLWAFSIGLTVNLGLPIAFFAAMAWLTAALSAGPKSFGKAFTGLAPAALPLAFAYHLAREGGDLGQLPLNPLGAGTLPLGDLERHLRYFDSPTPDPVLAAAQAGLIAWGFWIAVKILRHRGHRLFDGQFGGQFDGGGAAARLRLLPMFVFVAGMTGYHVWLLTRDMVMRM